MKKIAVTGGRNYNNIEDVITVMDWLHNRYQFELLIQGGAAGADKLCNDWAVNKGVHVAQVDANWKLFGRAAGYKRNSIMSEMGPWFLVAFPGGNGTRHMVEMCEKKGIRVIYAEKVLEYLQKGSEDI